MMANRIGDKFVIEIDRCFTDSYGNKLYRIKGFSSLVFDENGITKLTPYEDVVQIEVGDEVIAKNEDEVGKLYEPFTVLKIHGGSVIGYGKKNGSHIMDITNVKKTGRHFDNLQDLPY
jgi:hypothetical protein